MKAVQITEHGNLDVLSVREVENKTCKHDQVKVQIKASSINHLDIWVRNGLPGLNIPLPLILGSDGSGTIVEIGDSITDFNIGDNIVVQPGTFPDNDTKENYSSNYGILGETENGVQCEYVNLKEKNLHIKPEHLTFEESASMQLVFMTSYQMIVTRANLLKNETILIYGATSGIGSAAIQIAKNIGAKVISTVGNINKVKYAEDLGSDYVLQHYNNDNFVKQIKDITNNNGCSVIFEHVGSNTWPNTMKSLSIGGRVVTCGATTGPKINIDLRHLFMKQQTILGSTMSSIKSFKEVMNNINNKLYKPFVDKVFTFNEIKKAHTYIENREQMGKIVLVP